MLILTKESGQNSSNSGLNILIEAIHESNFIRKHIDFYTWQQNYVTKFIPHNVLIAAWGNFTKGTLNFDICSSVPEIHMQQVFGGCAEIRPLMSNLYSQWEKNNDKWIFNEEFDLNKLGLSISPNQKILTALLSMRSVLIYGFRDKRTNNDVIYAFFNSQLQYETQTSVLSAIMPHLDSALRGIDCLHDKSETIDIAPILDKISDRESAVLNLVVQGKTNSDIAEVLFISVNTVKNHLKSIFKKMEVSNRAEAVAKYLIDSKSPNDNVMEIESIKRLSVA